MTKIYVTMALIGGAFLVLVGMQVQRCGDLGPAVMQVGVQAQDGYQEALDAAAARINHDVGCRVLVPGNRVTIRQDDGEPCGSALHHEEGHAAGAYQCPDGTYDVLIARPGDIKAQMHIVAHELGHVLGLEHGTRGIMAYREGDDPQMLLLSDAEVASIKRRFCR